MPGSAYVAVYDLAERQHGVFSTHQARALGVSAQALGMMERRGMLDRVSHGVYALVLFPERHLARFVEAALWPSQDRGRITAEGALYLHGIAPEPELLHVLVPQTMRIRRALPSCMRILRGTVPTSEHCLLHGVPTVSVRRAFADLSRTTEDPEAIRQWAKQLRVLGHLSSEEAGERLG